MIEPKEFYRKLDSLLNKINKVNSDSEFIFTIVKELGIAFSNDLHIGEGRIYEKNGDAFILISPLSQKENIDFEASLSINTKAVQLVLNSKTYIFDNQAFNTNINGVNQKEYAIPAAILIHNQEQSWILLFELRSGWIREEIEFCLNAVRNIFNYRLQSESFKNEYEQAFLIQKSLLPTASPEISGYQIAGKSQQAELVGGDIFDYYKISDEEFGFCIGDASGHGIPAALMARDVIVGLRMGLENQTRMVHTLKKLNRVIHQSVLSTRFISLFYAEIEKNGNMFYVNAGHPPPVMFSANSVTELESTSIVFGALTEIDLQRSYINFCMGNVLVLFSDGILERENKVGEEFGILLLKEVIFQNKDFDAEKILQAIFETANKFGDNKKWHDDATVVVIKRIK